MASYATDYKIPKLNDMVWMLCGSISPFTPVSGKIIAINNIDGKGIQNVYIDIQIETGQIKHGCLSIVFDHKPELKTIQDAYGDVRIWD